MEHQISELIEISRYFGKDKRYVLAGGGNTSWKNTSRIWVKASGTSMKDITADNFAVLDREKLKKIYDKKYSDDSILREAEVKADLQEACVKGTNARPSVETSLHELIDYSFVVHTHPTLVNAITCAVDAERTIRELFGENALFIPYTDPGYILFSKIRELLDTWRLSHNSDPGMIFLQNHGVFVSSDSTSEIKDIYSNLELIINKRISGLPDTGTIEIPGRISAMLPALRMIFSEDRAKVCRIRNSRIISEFIASEETFSKVSLPFTPDQIVYCKARPVYVEGTTPEEIIADAAGKVNTYRRIHGYMPRVAAIRGYGIAAFDQDIRSVETILDVFEDWMQISYLSENFGGPHFMTDRDIKFIDTWEVENYRRQVASGSVKSGRAADHIVVVTGGAQGFGEGIAESMMKEGANVIIADLNPEKGMLLEKKLNNQAGRNEALFQLTDVTQPGSVQNLMDTVVKHFGGIDVLISNAGVLRAGSLEEMSFETFEFITRVNYTGFFVCSKYASAIMKLQAEHKQDHFTDIIQINSKSGLKGSNRNFAYAGSKFGSIGLTQSFALELIPWRIKVNAVCPGNFFEGPLWSDPETGLFVQYLKAGKVPGAKTLDEVRAHYEKQIPAGRGCRVEDVMKAIYYIMDQEYETGQALPVTGGQEMLK